MTKLDLTDGANKLTLSLEGATADITAGGSGQDGNLMLKDKDAKLRAILSPTSFVLDAADGKGRIFLASEPCCLNIGGTGLGGTLRLIPASATGIAPAVHHTVNLNADTASVILIWEDHPRIHIDGANGNMWLGGNGSAGDVVLFPPAGDNKTPDQASVLADGANGNIRLGCAGVAGNLALFPAGVKPASLGSFDNAAIHLNGQTGDILLGNADCAEAFDVSDPDQVEPGTLMVLDADGLLHTSSQEYDRKVAGVISGAGDLRPGIVLDKRPGQDNRPAVALMGKVYCKVDAQYSAIEVGDLLTSSATPGHAMKAGDPLRAFGAVIGKALGALPTGSGLLPILVSLQ